MNELAHSRRDLVVIGASAGGVHALTQLFAALPGDLKAAIAVTLHRSPSGPGLLASVVGRNSRVAVMDATDGQRIECGHVYLAPPDRHLIVRRGRLRLDRGPKHHHSRPAVDPMFTSAARSYGDRVIGVLLTGNLGDGATGLVEIKRSGGLCLVQDPREAPAPSMPRNALRHDHVDLVFRLQSLPEILKVLLEGGKVREAEEITGARPPLPDEVRGLQPS